MSILAVNATLGVIETGNSVIKTTYKCQYKDGICTVLLNTYPLSQNTTYYVVCSGAIAAHGKYSNISRSDVERKRFRYCQLEDVKN